MTQNLFKQARPLALALAFVLGGGNTQAADPPGTPVPGAVAPDALMQGSPPDMTKPVAPGKSEKADSAFKKLDPTGKGYVAKEDARVLEGFEPLFDKADSKHTGKLNYTQFKKAWQEYATTKNPGAGKAAW